MRKFPKARSALNKFFFHTPVGARITAVAAMIGQPFFTLYMERDELAYAYSVFAKILKTGVMPD